MTRKRETSKCSCGESGTRKPRVWKILPSTVPCSRLSLILFCIPCAKKPLQRSNEPPVVKQKASRKSPRTQKAKVGSSSK